MILYETFNYFDMPRSLYELLFAMTCYRSWNSQNLRKYRDPTFTCRSYSCSTICMKCCNIDTNVRNIACRLQCWNQLFALWYVLFGKVAFIQLQCGMHLLLMSHAFACLVAYICLTKVSLFSLVTKALRDTDGPLVFSNLWRQRTPSRKTAATTFFHLLGEWRSEDSLWFICCQLKHRPQLFHTSKKTKSTHL